MQKVFVQQNPDLAAELEMMQQLRLEPEEDIKFYNKAELLRTETPSINTTNYEEYFLLYVDNELTPAEKDAVEKFVLQHPALQEEFSLLKQTVLAPEMIEFGDKQSLYRKEEEEKRVVPFNWTRLAVAAAGGGGAGAAQRGGDASADAGRPRLLRREAVRGAVLAAHRGTADNDTGCVVCERRRLVWEDAGGVVLGE